MTVAAAQAFLDRVKSDQTLANELASIGGDTEALLAKIRRRRLRHRLSRLRPLEQLTEADDGSASVLVAACRLAPAMMSGPQNTGRREQPEGGSSSDRT